MPDPFVIRYRYSATMQLRTPLSALVLHDTVLPPGKAPPKARSAAHGMWVPRAPTWAELGLAVDIPEFESSTMASDLGPIPGDGGEYLPFLTLFRAIVEQQPAKSRAAAAVQALVDSRPSYQAFSDAYGGVQAMLSRSGR